MGPLRIAFIGAGGINFGQSEGPWDHASRLEKIGDVTVVAIVDVLIDKAASVLEGRKKGQYAKVYKDCKVFSTPDELLSSTSLDAVFIGSPPIARGSMETQVELKFLNAGVHVFVEKPLSVVLPEEFRPYVNAVSTAAKENKRIAAVGYMFRYHAAVRHLKKVIADHGGKIMAFNARYFLAYSECTRPYWWTERLSGGPIVEQATHFFDLARFIVGDVDLESVHTTTLRDTHPSGAGKLSKLTGGCEEGFTSEEKIPRVTATHWMFENGAIGSLMHTVALHGERYESEIDVLMDGLRLTLHEPYHKDCFLRVRDSRTQADDMGETFPYGHDDPYYTELHTFIEAVKQGKQELIASSYSDASMTYDFSWAVRRADVNNPAT